MYPMFCSSHFSFFVTFGDKLTEILCNLCLHFTRQDGQDGQKLKENHATIVTENQNKRIWDERNNSVIQELEKVKIIALKG